MDPILTFIKMYKNKITNITCFANCMEDNKEISIEVNDILIRDGYACFIGKEEVVSIPIDGAIIDLDYENEKNNLITVFNKKFGYITTTNYSI
jgi:hypothetical protein